MFTRWKQFVTVILEVKPAWKGLSAISIYSNKYCFSVFTLFYHYRHLLFHCQHPPQVHCLPSADALPMTTRIIFPHRVLSYHFPFQCLQPLPFIYSFKAKLLCLVFKVQTFWGPAQNCCSNFLFLSDPAPSHLCFCNSLCQECPTSTSLYFQNPTHFSGPSLNIPTYFNHWQIKPAWWQLLVMRSPCCGN